MSCGCLMRFFFTSLMVELRLDCSCVCSQSCTAAAALQGPETVRQAKLLEGCAKPSWLSSLDQQGPVPCRGIPCGLRTKLWVKSFLCQSLQLV